ncbi:MAG TPA: hypothetical protein VF092_10760 [Longimicrobium sp.]
MDSKPLKDAYWEIVADCLRVFHGYAPQAARAAARALREQVEPPVDPFPGYMRDSFYNREPFNVACGIAGHDLELRDHADVYMPMMDDRYAPAERIVFANGPPRLGLLLDGQIL